MRQISMSKKYNIQFLEDKLGKFDTEYKYPRISLIEGALFYVEKQTKKELEEEITLIKINESFNPTYIWGYVVENGAIYVTRSFGENKIFIFNPTSMKKTEFVKGKLKILKTLQKDTIDNLFDQKAVFDYFYQSLWNLRLGLGKEIRNKNKIPDNKALMEAQHIIDRIIFTYFICEKELISVRGFGPITGKELFTDILGQLPDPWHYLKKLFFGQFAKANAKELDCGGDVFIKTPYLNGGLFRSKNIVHVSEEDLIIEYDWNNIFNLLNKYTWIIEEEIADPSEEYEGNLTPEIIGHIYEKFVISIETLDEINFDELTISSKGDLKKGNKKIGAYYTPENITEYISRKTILSNIYDKIGIKSNTNFEKFINESNSKILNDVLQKLDNITICDPACGSGAFLLKAGEILLESKIKILNRLEVDNVDKYTIKKKIIIKNLYGVDIQEGAVEICKLRLWLWLISSSFDQKVEPLPNIEYNFTVGNSLIGWNNEKLDQNVLLQIDEKILTILDALNLHYKSNKIDEIKLKLQKNDMKSYAQAMGLLKEIYSYSTENEAEQLKNIIEIIRKSIYEKIDGIFYNYIRSEGIKLIKNDYDNLKPFHWKVDFNNIFEKGGFDIIIGNPPYVRSVRIKLEKTYYKDKFYSAFGAYDIYILFMEKALDLINNTGIIGLITPNKYFVADYAKKIRHLLLQNYILEITDFGKAKSVFEGVLISTAITFYRKPISDKDDKINLKLISDSKIRKIIDIKPVLAEKTDIITDDEIIRVYQNPKANSILSKIYKKCDLLSDHCEIRTGVMGFDYWAMDECISDANKGRRIATNSYIDRYEFLWGKKVNLYKRNVYEPRLDPKCKQLNSATSELFAQKKVVVRGVAKKLTAMLDQEGIGILVAVHSIISNEYDCKFILGLLNSKLYNWIHLTQFYSARIPQGSLRYPISFLKNLPLCEINNENEILYKKIINSVGHILELKIKDKNDSDVQKKILMLDSEIDNLIYELYGLTNNEITIIEESQEV